MSHIDVGQQCRLVSQAMGSATVAKPMLRQTDSVKCNSVFGGTLEPTQWRWECGQVRIAGLKASSRAYTRSTLISLHNHSHSPSAQAHFVPELTVRGIASESKFVHQFTMTYSMCVAATFIAWISSGFHHHLIHTLSPIRLSLSIKVTWPGIFWSPSISSANCSLSVTVM